ncbi:MAG: hypothetical protein R3C11_15680 [Planctomycetaceae bacterium]
MNHQLLDNLHSRIRLVNFAPSSSPEEIKKMKSVSPIEIPDDYLSLITMGTNFEFQIDQKSCFRIWGAEGCLEMNEAYHIQENLGDAWAIGDDEGSSALIYVLKNDERGLYLSGFGWLDPEDITFTARSLTDIVTLGAGLDVLVY